MVKLNKQQVAIVAQKVKEQVEKSQKVTDKQISVVDNYLKAKQAFEKQEKEISKKKEELKRKFETNNKVKIYWNSDSKKELVNLFKKSVSHSEIENEIVLNSIFDKSEDLDGFIAKLVKKFS